MMPIRLILVALTAALLTACAAAPGPVSYLLDAEARPTGVLSGEPLGLREIELPLIALTLMSTRGNQIKAAEVLGINRNTLRKKIRELDIPVTRGKKLM